MKLLITESQYNNFINNNKKTIIINETQYDKLLSSELVEVKEGKGIVSCNANMNNCNAYGEPKTRDVNFTEESGWSTSDGKQPNRRNVGFTVTGSEDGVQDLIHIKYFCGYYNPWCKKCAPTYTSNDPISKYNSSGGKTGGQYPSKEVENFVKLVWKLGISKVGNNDEPERVLHNGLVAYKELLKNRLLNATYTKNTETGPEKVQYPAYAIEYQLAGIQSLIKATDWGYPSPGYVRTWCPVTQRKIDYTSWVPDFSTWDAVDWMDAASLVLLAGSLLFPPLAAAAFVIEAAALTWTAYKYSKGEATLFDMGVRLAVLVGGPIVGRVFGKTLKYGKKILERVWYFISDFLKLAKSSKRVTQEMIENYIKAQKMTRRESKAFVETWEGMSKNSDEFIDEINKMEDVFNAAAKGEKAALKQIEQWTRAGRKKLESIGIRASNKASNKLLGKQIRGFGRPFGSKTLKNRTLLFWDEATEPLGVLGTGLMLGIVSYMGYRQWEQEVKELGYRSEHVQQVNKEALNTLTDNKSTNRLLNKYSGEDKLLGKLWKDRKWTDENTNKIIKRAYEIMTEKDFGKFNRLVGEDLRWALQDFLSKRYEVFMELDAFKRSLEGTLAERYANWCITPIELTGKNVMAPVTVDVKRSPEETEKLITNLTHKGAALHNYEKIGKYYWVYKGKYRGVWEIHKGTHPYTDDPKTVKDMTKDCKWLRKNILKICNGDGNNERKEFCKNVDIISIKLEELKEIPVKHSRKEIDKDLKSIMRNSSSEFKLNFN